MAKNSKIEWTNHTANIWWGCTKVHAGCDNCYAETLALRWDNKVWGNDAPRRMIKSFYNDLVRYQKVAAAAGEIHRVFVGSMMDIFEKPFPMIDNAGNIITGVTTGDLREAFFREISNGMFPNLMFLLLTKRPGNINKYIPEAWKQNPPENVMFGTSPVNQETFDMLVPQLLAVNGKRFLSIEPQLGPIRMSNKFNNREIQQIHWIIQGGESGPKRRPFDTGWAYSMYDQCFINGIPFFFKQIDKVIPVPQSLLFREFPKN